MRQWNARKDLPAGQAIQFPQCSVRALFFSPRKVVEGAIDNLLHFNEVGYDPYEIFDGDSKFYIPVTGYYECLARWRDDSSPNITRELWINVGSTTLVKTNVLAPGLLGGGANPHSATGICAGIFHLTAGSVLTVHASHWGAVNQVYDGGGTGFTVNFVGA